MFSITNDLKEETTTSQQGIDQTAVSLRSHNMPPTDAAPTYLCVNEYRLGRLVAKPEPDRRSGGRRLAGLLVRFPPSRHFFACSPVSLYLGLSTSPITAAES